MRILFSLFLIILSSCSTQNRALEVPKAVEGGWKLTSSTPLAATPPQWMTRLGLKQSLSSSYSGPIDASADIYEFEADSSAFESMQRWRPIKGEDQFYKRNLFVVVRSGHPNREMLMDFSRALQKAL